jgi:hypothetical protein
VVSYSGRVSANCEAIRLRSTTFGKDRLLFSEFDGNNLAFRRPIQAFEVLNLRFHPFEVLAGIQFASRSEVQG